MACHGIATSPDHGWVQQGERPTDPQEAACTFPPAGKYSPSTRRMVIDPSLFTTPVSFATWKDLQGDPPGTTEPVEPVRPTALRELSLTPLLVRTYSGRPPRAPDAVLPTPTQPAPLTPQHLACNGSGQFIGQSELPDDRAVEGELGRLG